MHSAVRSHQKLTSRVRAARCLLFCQVHDRAHGWTDRVSPRRACLAVMGLVLPSGSRAASDLNTYRVQHCASSF
eukprot:2726023-Pleurochrysis_carterae.AAC.3